MLKQREVNQKSDLIEFEKQLGESSLDAVKRFRQLYNIALNVKVAYAGRLDPMAEGKLLLMIGQECKNRDRHQQHNKTYEFEFIPGFTSDSYDLLGIAQKSERTKTDQTAVTEAAISLLGKQKQQYPPYSSFHIQGKPLFVWAKEGRLNEIEIPAKEIQVFDIESLESFQISSQELRAEIHHRINLVNGDFRQEEILQKWDELCDSNEIHHIYKFKASVSSGTYIRSLVHEIGQKLKTGAVTFSIKRTSFA